MNNYENSSPATTFVPGGIDPGIRVDVATIYPNTVDYGLSIATLLEQDLVAGAPWNSDLDVRPPLREPIT
jgi:hypothetical protein